MPAVTGLLAAGDDTGKASPLGLLVIILLVAICYFLYRSMSRHLRTVRENFPDQQADPPNDTSTKDVPRSEVDVSTEPQPFVPPVRPGYAVPGADDPPGRPE